MKKTEIIKNIINLIIDFTGNDNFEELEWLFGELSTAKLIEVKEKNV